MLECDIYRDRIAKAFNEGYELGARYARHLYGMPRRIEVEYIENTDTELEFTRLGDGSILNYGRSMPF